MSPLGRKPWFFETCRSQLKQIPYIFMEKCSWLTIPSRETRDWFISTGQINIHSVFMWMTGLHKFVTAWPCAGFDPFSWVLFWAGNIEPPGCDTYVFASIPPACWTWPSSSESKRWGQLSPCKGEPFPFTSEAAQKTPDWMAPVWKVKVVWLPLFCLLLNH